MDSQLTPDRKESEGWYVTEQAFEIIVAFIQPQSPASPSQTAADLDALGPGRRCPRDGETAESNTSFLLEFWQTLLIIARQVPHDHPAQIQLVQLVAELKSLPTKSSETNREIWSDLEGLENSIQESWIFPKAPEDSLESFQEWVNINSFISWLFGVGLIDFYYFAIWTLRHSMESGEETSILTRDLVENGIMASAQWIEHAGGPLFRILREVEASEAEQGRFKSEHFAGADVLSIKRWMFWKREFQTFGEAEAEGEAEDEQVRKLAIQAAAIMNAVDGSLETGEEESEVEE